MHVKVLLRTSIANLIRFGSGLFAVAMTPFIVRELSATEFNVWTLVLQLPVYVALLELGMSVAIVHFVAPHVGDDVARAEIGHVMNAAFALVVILVGCGVVITGAFVLAAPHLFTDIPGELSGVARVGFALVGTGASVGLLVAPIAGYFNAVQRNLVPSLAILAVRFASAVAVVLAVRVGLRAMFATMAAGLVVNAAVQSFLFLRDRPDFRLRFRRESGRYRRELISYSSTFLIWSIAGFLVSGLDIAVVGVLDFESVGAYGVAVSVVLILGGVHTAVMTAFVPEVAKGLGSLRGQSIESVLRSATCVGNLTATLSVACVVAFGRPLLELWAGDEVGNEAYRIGVVLVIGRGIGNLIWPYVVGLLGTGEHRIVRTTPLIEGVVNAAISIPAVAAIGAVGAAWGTLVGSTVAVVLHLTVNVPRTRSFRFDRREFLWRGVVLPVMCAIPLAVLGLVAVHSRTYPGIGLATIGALLSGAMSYRLIRRGFVGAGQPDYDDASHSR